MWIKGRPGWRFVLSFLLQLGRPAICIKQRTDEKARAQRNDEALQPLWRKPGRERNSDAVAQAQQKHFGGVPVERQHQSPERERFADRRPEIRIVVAGILNAGLQDRPRVLEQTRFVDLDVLSYQHTVAIDFAFRDGADLQRPCPEVPVVQRRDMRRVDEVVHDHRRMRLPDACPRNTDPRLFRLELGYLGNVSLFRELRVTEKYPDQSVANLDRKCLKLHRWKLFAKQLVLDLAQRAVRRVGPAVIDTAEIAAFNETLRELDTPVRATIFECMDFSIAIAKQRDRNVLESNCDDLLAPKGGIKFDGIPV